MKKSGDVSSVAVINMDVNFDTCGELYEYPKCLEVSWSDMDEAYLNVANYMKTSSMDIYNPTEYKSYYASQGIMDYNKVIHCSNYFDHMGLVYCSVSYKVDGISYSRNISYEVFGK